MGSTTACRTRYHAVITGQEGGPMTTESSAGPKIPSGMELTPFNAEFRENPHSYLDLLREQDPIHYDELMEGYILTRHADVGEVLRDRDLSVDGRKAPEGSRRRMMADRREDGDGGPSMLTLDPPDHDRLRGLVQKAFTPRAVERMRPRVRVIANQLLDAVAGREEFDLIGDYSAPLPTIVIAEMLGVDPGDEAEFKRLSDIVVQGLNPFLDDEGRKRVREAGQEMDAYLKRAIAERRAERRDDLISGLIDVEESGDQLSTDEIVRTCGLLLAAGNLTTTDLIGNGVLALLENPEQMETLRARPELLNNAVEEMIRYDPPVQSSGRLTLKDMEVAGCPVHAGSSLGVSLAAANHDPAVHPNPHKFDIERDYIEHVSFGGGRRYCLGANLARLETQEAIRVLVERFPELSLADREVQHRSMPGFRGLMKLLVQP
jgi:hypothetical protein